MEIEEGGVNKGFAKDRWGGLQMRGAGGGVGPRFRSQDTHDSQYAEAASLEASVRRLRSP